MTIPFLFLFPIDAPPDRRIILLNGMLLSLCLLSKAIGVPYSFHLLFQ